MPKVETKGRERRTARRYRVPGSARVFWGGDGTPVSIADMSAGGCLVIGSELPEVGTRVFLSLDIGGLPNVRLPAVTVRRDREGSDYLAAVRFDVPSACIGGLDKLLAQHTDSASDAFSVLLVDSDERSRARIAHAVRTTGAHVLAVDCADEARRMGHDLSTAVVLARADQQGMAALRDWGNDRPSSFRVAFGRKSAVDSALAQGLAQAAADDPCSAKCLGELLRRGRARAPS